MSLNELKLVKGNDPILKQSTIPFDFENTPMDPHQLVKDMNDIMIANKGIGLAAPQVGLPYSVFLVGDGRDPEQTMAFFNPKVVDIFGEMVYYEEGCLSYPGLFVKVRRPANVRLRFTDYKGETTTTKYGGLTARVIQHEYDHLQGITYQSQANRIHLAKAKKDLKLLNRKLKRNSV